MSDHKTDTLRDEIAKALYDHEAAFIDDSYEPIDFLSKADAILAVIQKHNDSEKKFHHVCCDFVKCSCVCHNDVPREPEGKP